MVEMDDLNSGFTQVSPAKDTEHYLLYLVVSLSGLSIIHLYSKQRMIVFADLNY